MDIRLVWLLVGLVGCGGNDGGTLEVAINVDCTAFLQWEPATTREDGTPFSIEEIDRFDIFIGHTSHTPYKTIIIDDKYLRSWEERGLEGGINYFTMTVTDDGGRISARANFVIKQVDERCQ